MYFDVTSKVKFDFAHRLLHDLSAQRNYPNWDPKFLIYPKEWGKVAHFITLLFFYCTLNERSQFFNLETKSFSILPLFRSIP